MSPVSTGVRRVIGAHAHGSTHTLSFLFFCVVTCSGIGTCLQGINTSLHPSLLSLSLSLSLSLRLRYINVGNNFQKDTSSKKRLPYFSTTISARSCFFYKTRVHIVINNETTKQRSLVPR